VADKDHLILDFRNDGVPEDVDLGEYYANGFDDDESADWDDIDLEDMFDLPPVLPPVRLPDEAELAVQARRSALLADLRALAGEVRTTTVHVAAVNPVLLRLAVELRCYAKPRLALQAGLDPEGTDLPAELQPERADVAWLIADMFGPFSHFDLGREKIPFDFGELQQVSGFEKPAEVFEAIARLDHPDAGAVLTMIGKHASDKTTAKAARRAAYKTSIRRPA
jgi:hypothetical protein